MPILLFVSFQLNGAYLSLNVPSDFQESNASKRPTRTRGLLCRVSLYPATSIVSPFSLLSWCRPCHQLSPVLEKLCSDPSLRSGTNNLPLDLIKVDVDSVDGDALAQQFKVM